VNFLSLHSSWCGACINGRDALRDFVCLPKTRTVSFCNHASAVFLPCDTTRGLITILSLAISLSLSLSLSLSPSFIISENRFCTKYKRVWLFLWNFCLQHPRESATGFCVDVRSCISMYGENILALHGQVCAQWRMLSKVVRDPGSDGAWAG